MDALSYNETRQRQLTTRHIFFPGWYALLAETVVAFIALIAFNASTLSSQWIGRNTGVTGNPLSAWSAILRQALDYLNRYAAAQRISMFVLWAVVGALLYVSLFRLAQLFFGVEKSLGSGVRLMRAEHTAGAMRWLASLHDFFLRMVLIMMGLISTVIGIAVCFSIASQELTSSLTSTFPRNALEFLASLFGALLCVRLITVGLSLNSRHFRNWYVG